MAWSPQVRAGFETRSNEEFVTIFATGGDPSISSTKARTGTYSLRLTANSVAAWSLVPASRLQMGYAFNHAGITEAGTFGPILLNLRTAANAQVCLVYWERALNQLELWVGGVLRDSVGAIACGFADQDVWHEVGLQLNVVNDSTGFASLYINGVRQLYYSGAIATANPTTLRLGGTAGTELWVSFPYVDDLMLDTSSTAEADAAPPNIRLAFAPITGAGSSAQWTAVGAATNREAVDDYPPDADTTYVWTATDNHRDLYTFGGYTAPEGYIIEAVIPTFIARKTAASSAMQIEPVVFDGTNTGVGTAIDLTSTYNYYWRRFDEKPAGGGAWGTTIGATGAVGQDAVVPA